ncbi:MAG: YdcF family protein [Chloroflexota bacterium]
MTNTPRVLLSVLLAVSAIAGWATFRIQEQGSTDERRHAGAIVVLGAAQYNGRPSPVFEARISHAVDLYRAGFAPLLIVTGGKATGDLTTEASAARAWAISRGVPSAAILSEDAGRTTLESLEGVAALLQARGIRTAVFVSDRTHMLRVLRIATDLQIGGWGSPTATGPADADPGSRAEAIVHELGALAVYFIGAAHQASEGSPGAP